MKFIFAILILSSASFADIYLCSKSERMGTIKKITELCNVDIDKYEEDFFNINENGHGTAVNCFLTRVSMKSCHAICETKTGITMSSLTIKIKSPCTRNEASIVRRIED